MENKEASYDNKVFEDLQLSEQYFEDNLYEACRFVKCDFSEATFRACKFTDCEFIGCNLTLTSLSGSFFSEVTFEECKMIGIDWTLARWPEVKLSSPIKFYHCNISQSNFFGLSLVDIVIEKCQANESDFREADLSFACFWHTEFTHCLFMHTNLSGADFVDAQHYNIDIQQNILKKAKFSFPEATSLLNHLDIEILGLEH